MHRWNMGETSHSLKRNVKARNWYLE